MTSRNDRRRAARRFGIGAAALCITVILFVVSTRKDALPVQRISDVIDASKPYSVIAVLPDVNTFLKRLRSGDQMRAFTDSPLGLHFLRSAPLRGAAHLHKLISLAPRSWQWNLYSLLSDGPVFYRSNSRGFVLVVQLNNKGKLATLLLSDAHAAKVDDWLVIASHKDDLAAQIDYLKKPKVSDSPLDPILRGKSSIGLDLWTTPDRSAKRSLVRALIGEAFSVENLQRCTLSLTPEANSLHIEGECTAAQAFTPATGTNERIKIADYPAMIYYRKSAHKSAHLIALHSFVTDYGYMIPQLIYAGPSSDQKSLEFLSQAFKTKNHKLETQGDALQIRYPYAYSYASRKYDVFSPHLSANRERFIWQTFLPEKKYPEKELEINAANAFALNIRPYQIVRNSEAALKQFDAVYSPGHFNEFRDALFKSLPSLKGSSISMFARPSGKTLKLGGSFSFADAQ